MKKNALFITFTTLILTLIFSCNCLASYDCNYSISKTIAIENQLHFSSSDISSTIADVKNLDGIIFCELPDPNIGVLKFGTRDLIVGDAITKEGIDSLKFISQSTISGTQFSYIPVYNHGKIGKAVQVSINVLKEENAPPTVKDTSIKTAKNIAICGVFNGADPENDTLKYSIVTQPKLGQVELYPDSSNKFLYTPHQNKSGKDTFKYIATDIHGNESSLATVTIEISQSKLKLTYSDMDNTGLQYQAVCLAKKGVLAGETIGNKAFLKPSQTVTRSEFIVMAMALSDSTPVSFSDVSTRFDDFNDTPVWAASAVSSAIHSGVVNGTISKDGKQILRPLDEITYNEAAVILNNIISPDTIYTCKRADSNFVSEQAKQATSNVIPLNILPICAEHTKNPASILTRSCAVELLYNASCIIEKEKG